MQCNSSLFKLIKYDGDYFWAKSNKFGSGKIHRRISLEIHYLSKRKNNHKKKRYDYSNLKERIKNPAPITNDSARFPTQKEAIIFGYWNSMKYPFMKHRKNKSVTFTRIISNLNKFTKKYEQQAICNSISACYHLFRSPSFVFRFMYAKKKIGLDKFLGYTKNEMTMFREWNNVKNVRKKYQIDFPDSWFIEGLKGIDYLEKKYCYQYSIPDDHPEITKLTIEMMQKHLGKTLVESAQEQCIVFSKMLFNFCELNKLKYYYIFDRIEEAINSFRTIKISKVHYLTTQIFWAETLPDELVRYNKPHYSRMLPFQSDIRLLKNDRTGKG